MRGRSPEDSGSAPVPQHRFFRNSLFGMVAGVLSAVGSLCATIIVARLLSVGGAGAYALGVWVAAMVLTVADLGVPVTIARFLPELSAQKSSAANTFAPALARPFRLSVAAGFLGILAFGLFASQDQGSLGEAGRQPFLFWVGVACLFLAQASASFAFARLRGLQRFDHVARLNAICVVLQLAATAAGSAFFGVPGALAGYMVGFVLPGFWQGRPEPGPVRLPGALHQRAWSYARTTWATAIISAVVWTRVEIVPLQLNWGVAVVGLFSVSLTLTQIATQLPTFLMSGLLPHFSERYAAKDWAGLHRAYASTLVFLAYLLLPACFGMAAIAPALLPTLFGAEFSPPSRPPRSLPSRRAWSRSRP